MSDEAHFHVSGFINKIISVVGLPQTPQNFMIDHFTVPKSQYGARYLHLELSVLTSGVPRGGLGGSTPPPPKFRNFDKVSKIKKILLYEMKFIVPNYSCLQNP
jgi:hypothetical protein